MHVLILTAHSYSTFVTWHSAPERFFSQKTFQEQKRVLAILKDLDLQSVKPSCAQCFLKNMKYLGRSLQEILSQPLVEQWCPADSTNLTTNINKHCPLITHKKDYARGFSMKWDWNRTSPHAGHITWLLCDLVLSAIDWQWLLCSSLRSMNMEYETDLPCNWSQLLSYSLSAYLLGQDLPPK